MDYTTEQMERYSRQIILKEIGGAGQAKLLETRLLLVTGKGNAIGAAAARHLAGAGIGSILLAGTPSPTATPEALRELNPDVTTDHYDGPLTRADLEPLADQVDWVLDASDLYAVRRPAGEAAAKRQKPFACAATQGLAGLARTYPGGDGACPGCIPPLQLRWLGIGVSPKKAPLLKLLGTLLAEELLLRRLGIDKSATGRQITFNAVTSAFSSRELSRNRACRLPHP